MSLKVYLSGEIHSSWREKIMDECENHSLPIEFLLPVTTHEASDAAGDILGKETLKFWRDHKSAKVNSIRISYGIKESDLVIIKFGDKYRQWNAAFDAGYAAAIGIPYLVIHPKEFTHALKEVDAQAKAVAEDEDQIIEILRYLTVQI